jgi:outer membrane protein assembly factor BamB
MSVRGVLLTFVVAVCLVGSASAENWPGWRGLHGDGTSAETSVPTEWDGETSENIAWKTEIPGTGHASPVVWGDAIFLTTCVEDTTERKLLRLDRATGEIVWQTTVATSVLETKHRLNSYASGTPATDGQTVYVTFLVADGHEVPAPNVGTSRPVTPGEIVVAAYDFAGEQKWLVKLGGFTSVHGFCSSPVIYGDLLIINGDHDGDSYVAALNRVTGKTVWKVDRKHKTRSYCTPLIRQVNGRDLLVLSGSKRVAAYDPATGEMVWFIEGPTEQFVASMVYDGQKFYMSAGFPSHHVMAIDPTGSGDVTDSHVVWHSTEAKCYVPSPVLAGNRLFVSDDRGTVNCFNTQTGERVWRDRLGMHYSASLVTANGLVYFTADDGITKVVRPADQLDVVAENRLGEYTFASPAISSGQIFIRGEKHLFAIGSGVTVAVAE